VTSGGPILIGCAHGTRSPEGQATIRALLDAVRLAAPHIEVREAYVDVHGPTLDEVVAGVDAGEGLSAVVVPLLLAGGYHVYHDIAQAIEARPDIQAAGALGPDARVIDVVLHRLREAHVAEESTLVLAAAGSSDPRAQADVDVMAEMLRGAWSGPVRVGFAAGHTPSVAESVDAARENGEEGSVAVASMLLAHGVFQERLHEAGADTVSGPLGPHPDIVSIVLDRYSSVVNA